MLISDIEDHGSELFGHEHGLHEAVHVACVAEIHHSSIPVGSFDVELLESSVFLICIACLPEGSLMYFVMNVRKFRLVFRESL